MKKFLSVILSALMIVSMMVGFAYADEPLMTISENPNSIPSLESLDKVDINVFSDEVALSGYEVFRSLNEDSEYGEEPFFTTTNQKYNNTLATAGNGYYYKVRAYVLVDGVKYYTNWSNVCYSMVKDNSTPMTKITSYESADASFTVSGSNMQEALDNIVITASTKLVNRNGKPAVTVSWDVEAKKTLKDIEKNTPREDLGGMTLAQVEKIIDFWKDVDWSYYVPAETTTQGSGQQGDDCLAAGTRITMADGSLKNIEDIVYGDEVLTYNHEAGKFEGQEVYLAWKSETKKCAFTLHFTNGIDLSVIGDHCLFEKESLSYAAIFENTAEQFIGKHFYNATSGRYEELLSVSYETEPVEYYEIYTEYNANCIAESMLNVALDDSERLNMYKFYDDLTIDHEQLANDIAEFGLYEYHNNSGFPKEIYDMIGWKYVNVMVGKGLGTMEDFNRRKEEFKAYL